MLNVLVLKKKKVKKNLKNFIVIFLKKLKVSLIIDHGYLTTRFMTILGHELLFSLVYMLMVFQIAP